MFVLAMDTATPAVTAGIVECADGVASLVTLIERVTMDARRHVESLLPQIRRCLSESGLSRSDLTAVVTGTGPGPFTGLRVGMVTAQAFADAAGLPLYGVCSLDAVAYAALHHACDGEATVPPGQLLVATDARRKEVYWAIYAADGARLSDAAVDTPARLRELLDVEEVSPTWAVGEGAAAYVEVLGLPVYEPAYPSSIGLVHAALERLGNRTPTEQPRPLYLRRPDATPQVPPETV
jgi:tRNA threonylcarbamoyl adenosine modification protein YeaZ